MSYRTEYRIMPTKWAVFKLTIRNGGDLHDQVSAENTASREAVRASSDVGSYAEAERALDLLKAGLPAS